MSASYATKATLLVAGYLLLTGAVSPQTPVENVPLDGPSIYKAYCASCHGDDGKGTGPAARDLKYKPTDLTTIAKNNKGAFPRATIEDVLQTGEKWKGHGSKEMPTWGPIFLAADADYKIAYAHVYNLVTFLESIQVK